MTQLNGQFVDVPIFNQLVPDEGPKAIRLIADFSSTDSYDVDATIATETALIKAVQTLYVDTHDCDQPVTFFAPRTGQRLIIPIQRQGYFPFLLPNPPIFSVTSQSSLDSKVTFIMLNVPMPCQWWPTV